MSTSQSLSARSTTRVVLVIYMAAALVSCSDDEQESRLISEVLTLMEQNAQLKRDLGDKTEDLEEVRSELSALYNSGPDIMLARIKQLRELGRLAEAVTLARDAESKFRGKFEAGEARHLRIVMEWALTDVRKTEALAEYIPSVTRILQTKLKNSAGGQLTDIELRPGVIDFTVSHNKCDYHDSVLLDFAIVCDKGDGWDVVKREVDTIKMTFTCGGVDRRYSLGIESVLEYHGAAISDFTLIDRIQQSE